MEQNLCRYTKYLRKLDTANSILFRMEKWFLYTLLLCFCIRPLLPPVPSPMFQPSISSLPVFFALSSLISAVFDNTTFQSVPLSWRPVKCSRKPSLQSNQATKLRTAVSISILLHVRLWFNSARKTKVSYWKLRCLQPILSNADTLTRRRPGRSFIKLVT